MNLYIVRHGQTQWNVKGVFQGRVDVPLTEKGEEQALETAQKFKDIPVDVILSSPLSRAQNTAKPISEITGVPITIDEDIIERSFGDMEGKKPTEEFYINKLLDFDLNYSEHRIETIQQLKQRVYQKVERIKEKYAGKDVVIVSHAGVLEMLTSYFQGIPPEGLKGLSMNNCEVRHFVIPERVKKIEEER